MKLKAIFLCVCVALLFSLNSCGTVRRTTKDLWITVTSPVLVPMAAGVDSYRDSYDVREGYQSGAWTQVISFPFLFLWNFCKHTFCVLIHVLDLPLNLAYGISELSTHGPVIEPLDAYDNTWVDDWHDSATEDNKSATDAESGEKSE